MGSLTSKRVPSPSESTKRFSSMLSSRMIRFLKPALAPHTRAYVVHGEPDQAEGFARRLMTEGAAGAAVPAEQSSVITSPDAGSAPVPAADESGKDAASDGD